MNNQSPFEEEQDPKLEVTLTGDAIEVRGVERLASVEEFKEKLKRLSPEQLAEMLRTLEAVEPDTNRRSINP